MTSNKSIKDQVKEIINFSLKDEQIYLKQNNLELYKYRFESNFSDFYQKYPTVMKKIVNGDDLKYLDKMIEALEQIQNNEISKTEAEIL